MKSKTLYIIIAIIIILLIGFVIMKTYYKSVQNQNTPGNENTISPEEQDANAVVSISDNISSSDYSDTSLNDLIP